MTTIDDALRDMRMLRHTHAGRLSGYHLRYQVPAVPIGNLPTEWAERLNALLHTQDQDQPAGERPIYLVCSDGMPVVWLTDHAEVITPEAPMTPVQARHQRRAAEALGDLHRHVLDQLADQRDQREGRRVLTHIEREQATGALRVAPAAVLPRVRHGPV